LYPEYLFPDLTKPGGLYAAGFVYLRELERILPQLLERGYILYNINDVFAKDENGIMRQKQMKLPKGKKPLILSVDDPSYHYGVGFANRMILDKKGELATEVITPEGKTIITYDGDVELVVNNFIKEHPEFSYRGAKGIVASTGYLGFFGHKLNTEESRQQAAAVADKLKETGWLFASHSFGHNNMGYWGSNSNPYNIARDTREWKNTIGAIVGETKIFISPFGHILSRESMEVILNNGFDIYCSVALNQEIFVYDRYALMSRTEIGGYVFDYAKETIDKLFFDVDSVKDKHRPILKGYF
jgi:peptidoglycan/xylan/chitin deacetylase (PgdA/CDA1 family)